MSKSKEDDKLLDNSELFFQYKIHIPTRTLFLGPSSESEDDTDHNMSERAIIGLHILDNLEGAKYEEMPITIKMKNSGGCVTDGFAIYDAIKECETEVHMIVYGTASSMGSVILQAADKRIIKPNAYMMIHEGETSHEGHPKDIERWLAFEKEQDKRCHEIYLKKIREVDEHFKEYRLKKMLDRDTILNSEQALELGLVDEIQ